MSPTPPRPGRPSRPARTPTSRPRRVAGLARPDGSPAPADAVDQAEEAGRVEEAGAPEVLGDERVDLAKATTAAGPEPTESGSETGPVAAPRRGRRTIGVLVAVIVLLLAVGVGEVLYLTSSDDGDGGARSGKVSAERPVQVADLTVRSVVDQAVTAADLILSASSADYDAGVERATATMTDPFAEQFRETKADVREEFVAEQTEVVIDVSYQGVVSATDDEVVALLFLTQTTQKGTRGGVTPVQFRVTVTMVDTPDGWLVSDLQAL